MKKTSIYTSQRKIRELEVSDIMKCYTACFFSDEMYFRFNSVHCRLQYNCMIFQYRMLLIFIYEWNVCITFECDICRQAKRTLFVMQAKGQATSQGQSFETLKHSICKQSIKTPSNADLNSKQRHKLPNSMCIRQTLHNKITYGYLCVVLLLLANKC